MEKDYSNAGDTAEKDTQNMDNDTPKEPSLCTDIIIEHRTKCINLDQDKVSQCGADPCKYLESVCNLENYNTNQSTEIMDQDNTNPADSKQLSNVDDLTKLNKLEIRQPAASELNINETNDIPTLTQHDLDNVATENITQVNTPETFDKLQKNNTEMDQTSTNIEKIDSADQNTPHNLDQTITLVNTSQTTPENKSQPITRTDIVQINTEIEDSGPEKLQPNLSIESIDCINTSNKNIDQSTSSTENLALSCDIPDMCSTSIDASKRIGTTLEMLQKLGTSVTKLYKQNTNLENSEEQMETEESGPPKEEKVKLFGEDKGPHWHNVVNNLITPPVIAQNLSKVFKNLPIFGKPENRANIEKFYDEEIRKYVGCDLSDNEYEELKNYCSIDNLRTGKEFTMGTKIPIVGTWLSKDIPEVGAHLPSEPDLFVHRKLKNRLERDPRNTYAKKLKYRGVRLIPLSSQEEQAGIPDTEPPDLVPGKDVLYRIRVYRPFVFSSPRVKSQIRGRHSVFSCDVVVCGRTPLSSIRARLVCRNDADHRLDVSRRPHARALTTAKEMFPSGFLFINNVFYVDQRAGCRDTSAVVRAWAAQRGLGRFPVRDMAKVTMQEVNVRLAHPEVYVHQGDCEHVFLVSEVRLVSPRDPLVSRVYPVHSAVSHNQTLYCTTCAEFAGKWIVTGCDRVPFDPAFFCDLCFKQYLYKDGKKIGDFKAYAYKGNELSMLKPQS